MIINRKSLTWEDITFRKGGVSALTREIKYKIRAVDTETYKGYAKLIAGDNGQYVFEPDIDAALRFFMGSEYMTAHTFCYNLRFDAQAILKLLPHDKIKEISNTGRTSYKGYKIKYIPKKLLTITDKSKHAARIYDLAQFFDTSLDTAAKTYIGAAKLEFPYRETMNDDPAVWRDNEADIIKYCLQDAKITAQLGQFVDDKIYDLTFIRPQSYISKASISKQMLRNKCFIPDRREIPAGAQIYALYAYKGGRFECMKKGYFPNTQLYDIVSAYADEVSKLIDPTRGKWRQVRDMHDGAYYGFYICHCYIPQAYFTPLAYVMKQGHLVYPWGEFWCYLTKQEIEAYSKYAHIEISAGWEFYPDKIIMPFHDYMLNLFNKKRIIPKEDYKYDLVKKMMNSIYGSTYEKIRIDDKIVAGKLFNSVYAAVITANVRIKLFLFAMQDMKKVIALATDSVLFKGRHNFATSKDIGGWDIDGQGAAVVLMSGIYEMQGKTKTRGIMKKQGVSGRKKLKTPYGEFEGIFNYIRERPKMLTYPYFSTRPLQMAEAIKSREKFTIEDINTWQVFEKEVSINGDIKRLYDGYFNYGGEIFTKHIDSMPFIITEE